MNLLFFEGVIILAITYGLIALRGLKRFSVHPWEAMLIGAALMMVFGVVSPSQAIDSINFNVIIFLASLFTIAAALEVSGFFSWLAYILIRSSSTTKDLIIKVFFSSAVLSLGLSNDGIAGSVTPILTEIKQKADIDIKPLLYALAFGVTIGSVLLPIGNPQNLLIALESNLKDPFINFLKYLLVPTIISLVLTYFLILKLFGKRVKNKIPKATLIKNPPKFDKKLTYLALGILCVLIPLYFITEIFPISVYLTPVTMTLAGALIIYVSSRKRKEILYRVNWSIMLLFVGLFIVSYGALHSGVISYLISFLPSQFTLIGIFIGGILISQVISNVPAVAIYIPILLGLGVTNPIYWVALAASTTIAGNLTVMGAASNFIISESAEKRKVEGFKFLEFIKYGVLVTFLDAAVYFFWLSFI